jgi:hypothetical protein
MGINIICCWNSGGMPYYGPGGMPQGGMGRGVPPQYPTSGGMAMDPRFAAAYGQPGGIPGGSPVRNYPSAAPTGGGRGAGGFSNASMGGGPANAQPDAAPAFFHKQ